MSKTKDANIDQQNEQQQEATATPQTLTAPTREELFQQVEALKAALPEGRTLSAGAVGTTDTGTFTIRIDII